MNLEQEVTLRDWGGQRCAVKLYRRRNGSVHISFTSERGYGYPSFELEELQRVVEQAEQMERAARSK